MSSLGLDWKKILALERKTLFAAGEELFLQGSVAAEVFFIEQGSVVLKHQSREGGSIMIATCSSGQLLGAYSVILEGPYPFTAIAHLDSLAYRIKAETFRTRLHADPNAAWHLARQQSLDFYEQVIAIVDLKTKSARLRFETLLLKLCEPVVAMRSRAVVPWPARQYEVASFLGVTQQHFIRLKKEIESDGLARFTPNTIEVLDMAKLRQTIGNRTSLDC